MAAAKWTLVQAQQRGYDFTWLCVTHKGVRRVNQAALRCQADPITPAMLERDGVAGDPAVKAGPIILRPGLRLRLSRNLDKVRGFVNSALGTIVDVLARNVATVQLQSGRIVLLHPVTTEDGATFLPCAYGYATTMRKAQGASLDGVVLYFDHCYPPERGYGYVGASRARTKAGLYHYGRLRRSDWLPVGGEGSDEQTMRSAQSDSSGESEGEDSDYEEDSDEDNAFDCFLEDDGEEEDEEEDAFAFEGLERGECDDAGLF